MNRKREGCHSGYYNCHTIYDTTLIRLAREIYVNPGIHKRKLAKQLDLKMPSIDFSVKKLGTLLIEKKSGNQINFYLNYSKLALIPLLCAVEHTRFEKLPSKIRIALDGFINQLSQKPLLAILFGSYVRGDFNSNSDVDILLVYQKIPKDIETTTKSINLKTGVKISPIYLEYSEFNKLFHNPTKAFFRKIRDEKIVIAGIEWWRRLVDEES